MIMPVLWTFYGRKIICLVIFFSFKLRIVLSQDSPEHRVMRQSCEGDWVRYGESCYRYYTSQKAWIHAFKTCQFDDGFLTDIENQEEQAFLQNLTNGNSFWISGSDAAGKWLWYGSIQPWAFTKWDTGQPDDYRRNEHCALVRPNGRWNDLDCSVALPFVCKRKVTLSFCDKTWNTRNGRCYKVYSRALSWTQSLEFCQSKSSTLVNIEDVAEQTYVNGLYNSANVWVGGFDGPTNGVWAWAGTTLAWNYQYWSRGQPDNAGQREACMMLLRGGGAWNDGTCYSAATVVMCERNTFHLTNNPVLTIAVGASSSETTFICAFSLNISDTDFLLEWYQNDEVIKDQPLNTNETESSLHERDITSLEQGDQIKCVVTPCMPGNCSIRGSPSESNVITATAQVASDAQMTVAESSGPAYINVTSTVPPHLFCKQGHRADRELCNPYISIELVRGREKTCGKFRVPVSQAVFGMYSLHSEPCTHQMTMDTWSSGVLIPVKATLDGIMDRNQYRNIRVLFTVSNVTKLISTVKMTVLDEDRVATCSSINDPHMTTFDKRYYDNYLEGEFILYKHKTLPYEVRTFYRRCNRVAACNCAVAVKSGNDVILVDVCGPSMGVSTRRSIFTIKMFLNGELTPGTDVISHGGGKTFEVVLPIGTRIFIMTGKLVRNSRFLNVKVAASTFDFNQTEGLCGTFDGNRNNDLMKRNGDVYTTRSKQPNEFSLSWRVSEEESLFRGDCRTLTSNIAEKSHYCDCLERQAAVCQEGIDVMTCTEIQKRRGLLNGQKGVKLITQDLIDDAESPPVRCISTRKSDSFEHDPKYTQPDPVWPTASNITETMAKTICEDFLGGDKAGALCTKLPGLNLDPIVQGCINDIQLTDTTDWAKESLDNLLRECITIVEADTDQWGNETDEAGPPLDIINNICPDNCRGNGNCTEGLCQCFYPWIGDDCSVNSTVPPELHQVGNGEPCDSICSQCLSVRLFGENFADVDNLTCHYRILNLKLDPISDVRMIKAAYLNSEIIKCTLPNVALYEIAVSNNREVLSEYTHYIVYNSRCHRCNSSLCTVRNDVCRINGDCLEHGFVNPVNDLEVCNVTLSKHRWSLLNVMDIPKKSYDFIDISDQFVLTKDSKVLVGGNGFPTMTTDSLREKALVLDGNQYLSMGDLVNTSTCFVDTEKNPLGITINLDVKLTRIAGTCFVFSTGGEEVSNYGYAMWLENDSLYAKASNKRHEWVVSTSNLKMDKFIHIQMMWSLQSGLLLSIDNDTKVSSKMCISRPASDYTALKEFVLGSSSKKDRNCKMIIEFPTFVCSSCENVKNQDLCFIERVPPLPRNSCINSSVLPEVEAALISTSVLSGISVSIVCCLCLIFGFKRRRKKKKRHSYQEGNWTTKSKRAEFSPVFTDNSGTSAYRHHWTGEVPVWREYRYKGQNQIKAIPHELEVTNKSDIKSLLSTSCNGVRGFSDQRSAGIFGRSTHDIRTGHLEKTNNRIQTSFSVTNEYGNFSNRKLLANETVLISTHETNYQTSTKENLEALTDNKLIEHETFTDRLQTTCNTRQTESHQKKTFETFNDSLSKDAKSDENRYVCSYCMSHGELELHKRYHSSESISLRDNSCQTETYYLLRSRETLDNNAGNSDRCTYKQVMGNGYQRNGELGFLSSNNSCSDMLTSQATTRGRQDADDNHMQMMLGSVVHTEVEEREEKEAKQSKMLSAARERIAKISQKSTQLESSIELNSLDNAVYLSGKGIKERKLSLEVQEESLMLQSENEEDEESSMFTETMLKFDDFNVAAGKLTEESIWESYRITTEWIPRNKMEISSDPSTKAGVLNHKAPQNGTDVCRIGFSSNVSQIRGNIGAEKLVETSHNTAGKIFDLQKESKNDINDKELISTEFPKGFVIHHKTDNGTQERSKPYTGERTREKDEAHYASSSSHVKGEEQSYVNVYHLNGQVLIGENQMLCQHCSEVMNSHTIQMQSNSSLNLIQAKPETLTIVKSNTETEMKPEHQSVQVFRQPVAEIFQEKSEKYSFEASTAISCREMGKTRVDVDFRPYENSIGNHRSDEDHQNFAAGLKKHEIWSVIKSPQQVDMKQDVSRKKTKKKILQKYDMNTSAEKADSPIVEENKVFYKADGIAYRYRPDGSKEFISKDYNFGSGSYDEEPLQKKESVTKIQRGTTMNSKEDIPAHEWTSHVYRYRQDGSKEFISEDYNFGSGSYDEEPLQKKESVTKIQRGTTMNSIEDIPAHEWTSHVYRFHAETSEAAED